MEWSNLPHEILYIHILPLLPIDIRLSFKIEPRKLSNDIIENLQTEINKIENKRFVSIYRSEGRILEFLQIKKHKDHLEKEIYVRSRFYTGEYYAEYMYLNYGDQVNNMWEFNIDTTWEHNIFDRKWVLQK
jgi:hypothetical protein